MLPWSALDEVLSSRYHYLCNDEGRLPSKTAARLVGSPPSCIRRWRSNGKVSAHVGDRLATRIGLHPMSVWPQEWDAYLNRPARPCKDDVVARLQPSLF